MGKSPVQWRGIFVAFHREIKLAEGVGFEAKRLHFAFMRDE